MQLFDHLTAHGPATATQLAERLGETSGATSYHLRQLARFGFIEHDSERGAGRERYWRRVDGSIMIDTTVDDAAAATAGRLVSNEFERTRRARYEQWHHEVDDWAIGWRRASADSTVHLRVTAAELADVRSRLEAVVDDIVADYGRRSRPPAPGHVDPPGPADDDDTLRNAELHIVAFPLSGPTAAR